MLVTIFYIFTLFFLFATVSYLANINKELASIRRHLEGDPAQSASTATPQEQD